jgi:hypothetical protein
MNSQIRRNHIEFAAVFETHDIMAVSMSALLCAVLLALLTGCAAPPPVPVAQAKPDPTKHPAYLADITELTALNRRAEDLFQHGKADSASAEILTGQAIQARLLAAPQPTLEAMEAASDLDDLYARMLLANHNDGWARLFYQKNVSRWKLWSPATADTSRRLRLAQAGLAECDRRLAK